MSEEKIGGALRTVTPTEMIEMQKLAHQVGRALQPWTKDHTGLQTAYKAVAHALLYRARRAMIPAPELLGFMRDAVKPYVSGGLQLSDKTREQLESGAGMPVWESRHKRRAMDACLRVLYQTTDSFSAPAQIRLYWHLLMANAERLGMTHEAVFRRLEVLDTMQRAEGPPMPYTPKEPPSWARKGS